MKQVGTTIDGSLLVELSQDDLKKLDAVLLVISQSAMNLGSIFRLSIPAINPGPAAADVAPPPQIMTKKVKAPKQAMQTACATTKARENKNAASARGKYKRHNSLKSEVIAVMVGKGVMTVQQIVAAYVAHNGVEASDAVYKSVAKVMPTYKGLFERVSCRSYRLIEKGQDATPAPVKTAPVKPAKLKLSESESDRLLTADPAILNDDDLRTRLMYVRDAGRSDNAGRIEFIKRASKRSAE